KTDTVSLLKEWVPDIDWTSTEAEVQERIKGEFVPIRDGYSEAEKFYLTSNLYLPVRPFSEILQKLALPVESHFHSQKTVTKIDGDKKIIEFSDGSEQKFEKLFWCSDLALLFKLWSGVPLRAPKANKKTTEMPSGVNVTLELESPLFDSKNTVVLPFRFKDCKLRALGVPDLDEEGLPHRLHWMIFLPKELMEDREEIAKCVRTLKRELLKEFPGLLEKTKKEKIVYLPILSGEEAARWASLEITSDIFYLGPQVYLKEEESEWRNLDLLVSHASYLRSKEFHQTS
ncbi:MAG: hypothetical protein ACKN9V_09070, partial [Pseudomonadota bacterium]